ncbi:uncharacterized protein LOC100183968 [Ciona intestinalis]
MATTKEFESVLKQAEYLGVTDEQLNRLKLIRKIRNEGKKWQQQNSEYIIAASVLFIAVVLPIIFTYCTIIFKTQLGLLLIQRYLAGNQPIDQFHCIVDSSLIVQASRPPVNCSTCAGVTDIIYATNLSPEEFLEKYAFNMQPLVVKDGQGNWTARETFSFEYFKGIYAPGSKALKTIQNRCQFFPYNTEMQGPEEFFNMSKSRFEGKEDHWYIGWSNCAGASVNEIKSHYQIPYFIPIDLDHSRIDWIFMGLPGLGAPMHLDLVYGTSWQAQLSGYKKWTLQAPPECWGICPSQIEFTVGPGDIMVFDGNRWFHQTDIVGDEMSVVIGSEFF